MDGGLAEEAASEPYRDLGQELDYSFRQFENCKKQLADVYEAVDDADKFWAEFEEVKGVLTPFIQ